MEDWYQAIIIGLLGSITFGVWEMVKVLRQVSANLYALRHRFVEDDAE